MNYVEIITAAALVLSGTVAGYITNKYAVRWLFKPVTFFGIKLFDVSILSTEKKQINFIESLSDCVETKILTNDVLKKEIINETMKQHLDEIIDYFISEALPDSFKDVKLSEMDGFNQSTSTLREYVYHLLGQNADPLLVYVLDAIKVSDYLTETQIDAITDNFYESIKNAFTHNNAIKERLTGILTELFFTAMFNSDGRTALGKLTSKLFTGGSNPAGGLSGMTLPEKIGVSVKAFINTWISGLVSHKSAGEYVKDEQRESIADRLRKEILKKYDEKIQEISDKGASTITKSLGQSSSLKETISNVVFDYLDKNLTQLMGGKVKDTVKIALGRLNPDQLCEVAERLLKGELKYLSYFGAVLGFIISIPALALTLGNFSATGFSATPQLLAFGICLMAFIGIFTNIIAIHMFFHPYKKIGFLPNGKHTRAFSQGLILQNQKVFAHTLGEYIGQDLLTANNIIKMLENHKESFIQTLFDSLVPAIKTYLENEKNSQTAAARLSALVFNKITENRATISDYLSGNLGERTIRSLVDLSGPENRSKAINLYMSFLNKERPRPEYDGTDESDYRFVIYALTNLIKSSQSLTNNIWHLLYEFYDMELAAKPLDRYLSLPEFSDSIKETLIKICQNDEAFHQFRHGINACIQALAAGRDRIAAPELIDSVSKTISESAYASAINCIPDLIKDVHIDKITSEKVASLAPEEIQALVMSFARPVFFKLYALGSFGGIFGINTYLAFLFFIVDKLAEDKNVEAIVINKETDNEDVQSGDSVLDETNDK